MIKKFAEIISQIFPSEGENMIAVNGLGQFVLFLDETTNEQAEAYMSYVADEVLDYNKNAKCKIEYKCGIAEAETDNIFKIRALMICAINKAGKSEPENPEEKSRKASEAKNTDSVNNEAEEASDKIVDLIQRLERIKQG